MQMHLTGMLDKALRELSQVDLESTCPVDLHMFSMLCNLFASLDILSVALTGDENTQFSHVQEADLLSAGCNYDVVVAFVTLQKTRFTGVVACEPGRIEKYSPWHIWSVYKHRGVGSVRLQGNTTSLQVKFGDVVTPLDEIKEYVKAAHDLVKQALRC